MSVAWGNPSNCGDRVTMFIKESGLALAMLGGEATPNIGSVGMRQTTAFKEVSTLTLPTCSELSQVRASSAQVAHAVFKEDAEFADVWCANNGVDLKPLVDSTRSAWKRSVLLHISLVMHAREHWLIHCCQPLSILNKYKETERLCRRLGLEFLRVWLVLRNSCCWITSRRSRMFVSLPSLHCFTHYTLIASWD